MLTWDIFEIKNVRKIKQQFVIKYILVEALYVPVRNFNSISVKLSSMNSSPVSGILTTSISSGSVDHPEGPEIMDEKDMSLVYFTLPHRLHVDSITPHRLHWTPHGLHVDSIKLNFFVDQELDTPYGLHMDSMWTPCGVHKIAFFG